jgi:hypothetical protein
MFTLVNNSATQRLTPLTISPASLFSRLRIISQGGAELENIESFATVQQMFETLLPADRSCNQLIESWQSTPTTHVIEGPVAGTSVGTVGVDGMGEPGTPAVIAAGGSRRMVVQLFSGILNQTKLIPLSLMPLEVTLEIGDPDLCFDGTDNDWYLQDVRLCANIYTLDNTLQNSFAKHIEDGKELQFSFSGTFVTVNTIGGAQNKTILMSRGFTRVSTVFWTFQQLPASDGAADVARAKKIGKFYNPLNGTTPNASDDNLRWNIQIGSQRFPSFDAWGVGEHFYRLRQATLTHFGSDSFGITGQRYRTDKYINACELEKAPGVANHTGVNTRGGSALTLNLYNLGTNIDTCTIVVCYDLTVRISSAGVEVLE